MMNTKRRGLGRGLESLIPLPTDRRESGVPQLVAVDQIRPSDQQVRRSFDSEALRELAESIRSHGLLQPVLYAGLTAGTAAPGFRDITSGSNGAYSAGPGWDACTGLGSPEGSTLLTKVGGGQASA
jgi:hypothetical protein